MAIHHVHVQPVDAGGREAVEFGAEVEEVGTHHGGGEADH